MKTSEALEIYLRENQLKPKTIQGYRYTLGLMAESFEEFPSRGGDLLAWIHSLEKVGLGAETRRTFLKRIKAVAVHLKRNYDILNPCENIKRGAVVVPHKERRFFTSEELMNCLQACKTMDERLLISLLIETGARISELCLLKVEDVREDCIITSVLGKTGEHRYQCSNELVKVIRDVRSTGYVLGGFSKDGKPKLDSVKKVVRNIVIRAGIKGEKLGAHTFRHSVGTMIADKTGSALQVMKVLQHGDINTSMKYIHSSENRKASGISPMRIVQEEIIASGKAGAGVAQMALTGGKASSELVVVKDGIEQEVSIIADMFKIPDGCDSVRPKLKRADLEVMASAFVMVGQSARYGSSLADCKKLWDRIMRLK